MGANTIFVIGANSAIARACLRIWAAAGATAYLVGRDTERLHQTAAAFRGAGGTVAGGECLDFRDPTEVEALVARGFAALGRVDCVFIATGVLPDEAALERAPAGVHEVFTVNLATPAHLLLSAANRLAAQGHGCLAALSSVAGDIGRRRNAVYGATKAGLSTLMQGLEGRFAGTPVRVLDIRPGLVRTPMTMHLRETLFFASPERVARRITRAIQAGRQGTLYVPGYWRWIMAAARHLPACLRRRLRC